MKFEEFRQAIPSDDRTPLPKGEQGPCMRGVLDVELYNRTKEVVMREPLTEFVPPVVNTEEVHPPNQKAWRRGASLMNAKKPSKEVLESHLRNGMTADEIGKKYDTTRATVYNWIRSYELQGLKGQRKAKDGVQETPPVDDMVQHTPTLTEIEQFHTDNPVQELPKVEMDPDLYPCADCGKGFWGDGHTNLCVDCSESLEPQGMTAEENMTDTEWENQEDISFVDVTPEPKPKTRETFDEIWSDVRSDLVTLERLYVAEAKKSFRERLREMLAEVVGTT